MNNKKKVLSRGADNINSSKFDEKCCLDKQQECCDDIAIVGLACRFPDASTVDIFWENLMSKKDSVNPFPEKRMKDIRCISAKGYKELREVPCKLGAYFDRIDLFDHAFFRITPTEARVMDPAHRIFLEVAVEALENAGITESQLKGSKTSVIVGYSVNDDNYIDFLSKDDPNIAFGNQPAMLAYRLAYYYDLSGPTMVIDTTCSSSLVAVHQACLAIKSGDCDQSVVGGVSIRIFPAIRNINNLSLDAYDGRCRTFDEKASGTNTGDGVGVVVLKKLIQAKRDNDFIYAVIKGSSINSDGSSNGLTVPDPSAQSELLCSVWEKADICVENLNFIETHGTGTKLGDPIEFYGICQAFQQYTDKKQFCALGAVKTNIGHLEAAAGIAGLIKSSLALKNRMFPPNIHFHKPNPYINFQQSPVYIPTEVQYWQEYSNLLTGGVSSFGLSGTNCHVVLSEYRDDSSNITSVKSRKKKPKVFITSARTKKALKQNIRKLVRFLNNTDNSFSIGNLAFSSIACRDHYDYSVAFVVDSCLDLLEKCLWYDTELENTSNFNSFEKKLIFFHHRVNNNYWQIEEVLKDKLDDKIVLLLTQYFNMQHISYDQFFPSEDFSKVPLPTYSFDSVRHWTALEVEESEILEDRAKKFFYNVSWKKEKLGDIERTDKGRGKIVVFMHKVLEQKLIYRELNVRYPNQIIKILPGKKFEKISESVFYVNPTCYEDYIKLVTSIDNMTDIVHMWDFKKIKKYMNSYENIVSSQDISSLSVFHLLKALSPDIAVRMFVIVSSAHQISEEDKNFDPVSMPVFGVIKVISQERPKVDTLGLDVDINNFDDQIMPTLLANEIEFFKVSNTPIVAYRSNKRFVQVLENMDIVSHGFRSVHVRAHGTYLIAGGAGYLGLETAIYLAEQGNVNIVLTGRKEESELTPKQKGIMEKITNLNSNIVYMKADVTDPKECEKVILESRRLFGGLNGIFVAIKNISHKRMEHLTSEEFHSNVLSKLKGVYLLDLFTIKDNLDFMATFSSISSLTGGPTGMDCSASNLFLDSFGSWRNTQGRNTITMNFTLIDSDDGSTASDRLSMIPPITKEEFLYCLDICMRKRIDFAVMANFYSRVMRMVLPLIKIRFSDKILSEFKEENYNNPKPISSQPTSLSRNSESVDMQVLTESDFSNVLQNIWKEVLGYSDINLNSNFFDIGGDSISAVKLTHLIKVQLHVQCEVSDIYSYPTLKELAYYFNPNVQEDSIEGLLSAVDEGSISLDQAVEKMVHESE